MDELLLSKIRLGIIAELLTAQWIAFSELQRVLDVSQGNLGAHLAKLVAAGYVDEEKSFVNRRPQTRYRLTRKGRSAFTEHVSQLQSLLKASS
ncbi:MAG: transcriptional regulator [Candidatus Eremiobacteraeota bacterium]|nr:transcriptional regulator [Candidatus Eremiobacteraeota bacterium]